MLGCVRYIFDYYDLVEGVCPSAYNVLNILGSEADVTKFDHMQLLLEHALVCSFT